MRQTWVARFTVVAGCAVAVIADRVQGAQASYPGANGLIAFGMRDATGAHVYSVRPNGHGLRQLTDGRYADLCAAYSATGRNIAFCSNRSGSFQIWAMTAHGHRVRQLTNIVFAAFPDYSPHGGRIAFDGQVSGDPNDEVFVMNSDGTDLRRLTSGAGNNDYPAWHPTAASWPSSATAPASSRSTRCVPTARGRLR